MNTFKEKVYSVFSDTLMIALALLIIPVLVVQNFLTLKPTQEIIVSIIDWLIWIAFFLEFILKLFVADKKIKWLSENKLDSVVSVVVIVSPILEHSATVFAGAPLLRLLRLTRLARFAHLLRIAKLTALVAKIKHSWKEVNLKVYVSFFVIVGIGLTASFITTGLEYSDVDSMWISLFVSTFGVFYAFVISFFVFHVWGKFSAIGSEISKEVNSLRNAYLLFSQLSSAKSQIAQFTSYLEDYVDSVVNNLWGKEIKIDPINKKFVKLINLISNLEVSKDNELVLLDNIIEELRTASASQSNLTNLAQEKTPKILWILLLFLSIVLVGSFIFLGFQDQLLATILITLVTSVIGIVVALIFDIDKPLETGFWNISPNLYLELKKNITNL